MTIKQAHADTIDGSVDGIDWLGGVGTFICTADNFNGSTVTLQAKVGTAAPFAVGDDTTVTVSGGGAFTLPACELLIDVSGTTLAGGSYAIEDTIGQGY